MTQSNVVDNIGYESMMMENTLRWLKLCCISVECYWLFCLLFDDIVIRYDSQSIPCCVTLDLKPFEMLLIFNLCLMQALLF